MSSPKATRFWGCFGAAISQDAQSLLPWLSYAHHHDKPLEYLSMTYLVIDDAISENF